MTALSPFSDYTILSQWKRVNEIIQEPLELGHDIWRTECGHGVDDLI